MIKYEVKKDSIEVPFKKRHTIKSGIIFTSDCGDPVSIASFNTFDEAMTELNKHKSTITKMSGTVGTLYMVEEYFVEETDCDEDGWSDKHELTPLPFSDEELAKIEE